MNRIQITEDQLFAVIGRLYIENMALQQQLAAAQTPPKEPEPPAGG